MTEVTVTNTTRSLVDPLRVNSCESFACRLKGLMFQKALDHGSGLLMVQKGESRANAAIHMFFVGMDLGVIWLDNNKTIVDIKLACSWKTIYTPQHPAKYILEVHPDRLPEFNVGDVLRFE
jgi:uncharacterized membrane protein (UPF0127 family)